MDSISLPPLELTHVCQASSAHLSKLQVLHLRNWLYRQQIAYTLERLTKIPCQDQIHSRCDTVIALASGQCYKLADPPLELGGVDEPVPYAVQVDDAPYRDFILSWM